MLSDPESSYLARFEHLGELADLHKAIEMGEEIVSLTPGDHPNRLAVLNCLGSSYLTRFKHFGELADLSQVIEYEGQALLLAPSGHPDRLVILNNLGGSYQARFERLGEFPDLNNAIECGAEALSLTPNGHPNRLATLNNLGGSYLDRFDHLGEVVDLNKAIEYISEASSLTPDSHPAKPAITGNLGDAYRTRFEHVGDSSDLSKAIECGKQAISLLPNGHPERPRTIGNLGNSYRVRFEHSGDFLDINKAIECGAEAVLLAPDNHMYKPVALNNLGISHWIRFERLGELLNLNKAVEFQAKAVALTPDDDPEKSRWISNLGCSYLTRFERFGELSDLNQSLEHARLAVSLTPPDHPDRPDRLSALAIAHQTRFDRLGELSDLNKAADIGAAVVTLTPNEHPNKPGWLINLGTSLRTRFKRLGGLSDLTAAIECGVKGVLLTPNGHPDKPKALTALGDSYLARYEKCREQSDYEYAVVNYSQAAQSLTGSPFIRFMACRKWAQVASSNVASSPRPAYQRAMELIPLLVWIGTTIDRRYERITQIGDFATEAASYAIAGGSLNLALEWLEAGRSIVWGQIAQLRTPFERLAAKNPELARRLEAVGRKLEHASSRLSQASTPGIDSRNLDKEAGSHLQLALEWDKLLSDARSIPGFKDFLSAPKSSQLLEAAKSHPVVVINIHASRCDALVVQPNTDTISHVTLADFSMEQAIVARQHIISLARQRKPGPPLNQFGSLERSVEHLWSGVVKPVLDFLGYKQKLPIEQLPRITWCTTGLLSFLPLHATGSYEDSQLSTFDLVISSYTPTLSALLKIRSQKSGAHCRVLAVGQENTPGLPRLPCTKDELTVIKKYVEADCYLELENEEATIDRVLSAMDEFSWVHMACHGSQDTTDPTQSAFHLHNGGLTLAMVTKQLFVNKGLAYLSACQTAAGDKKMPDEAVHLAAGMLMAGYQSVIGTMWSIVDEDGPEVADRVYAELMKDGKMDYRDSARALHRAIEYLRAKEGISLERWAPFIHIGL